ncbi:MAG: hypothetical protein GF329_05060 [Candidatus Lokiarchaeota archaeon]|nr:hypothetical protein [Candidatus Lokiarchaeota archaeon]
MKFERINKFFNPESLAIIGASRKSWGASNSILNSLIHKKYPGDIYLINARAEKDEKLHGRELYQNIKDCPEVVDLVFIIVPGKYVKSVIQDCIDFGIKNVVIISAGFSESLLYNKEKVKEGRQIVKLARKNDLRFIGPNCNGIINVLGSFYGLFGPRVKIKPGDCSYVSRGGTAIGNILIESALCGFSANKLVNLGDQSDLKVQDFIKYYDGDPTTKVIGVYTEGISDAQSMLEILKDVKKPVIFYKSGRTKAGKRAALSHVGAIAGDDTERIYKGFINQTQIIPVDSIDEMVDVAMALSLAPLPSGNKIGVFTYGGSLGVMMSDAAEKHGLKVAKLNKKQLDALNKMLPEYWSHNNPVDVTDGNNVYQPRNLIKVMKIIIDSFDALFITAPVFENDEIFDINKDEQNFRKMYQELVKMNIKKYRKIIDETNKPIFILGDKGEFSKIFINNNIPVYDSFNSIARSFEALYKYSKILSNKHKKE